MVAAAAGAAVDAASTTTDPRHAHSTSLHSHQCARSSPIGRTVFLAMSEVRSSFRMGTMNHACCRICTVVLASGTLALAQPCEVNKILAPDGSTSDKFGISVAVDGRTAVVGAIGPGNDAGAAYVVADEGDAWRVVQTLTAFDAEVGDWFGWSVDIDDDTIVVGSRADDDLGGNSGSAYVYTRVGDAWQFEDKLVASDGEAPDLFGSSVTISGDTIAVGAVNETNEAGAVYIFTRSGNTWTEQLKLTAFDRQALDEFGTSVALEGDVLAVGSIGDDDNGSNSGSVYVYRRAGTTWPLLDKIVPVDGAESDNFGTSVDIDGVRIVVGAPGDDDMGPTSGSATVFRFQGGSFVRESKLIASDGVDNAQLGETVAMNGTTIAVGAFNDDTTANATGSLYIYHFDGLAWSEHAKLAASDAQTSDNLGGSLGLTGDQVVVGAQNTDELGNNSGAAYAFAGVSSSEGLSVNGPMPGIAGALNTIHVRCATPLAQVVVVYGLATGATDVPGCPGVQVAIDNPRIIGSTSSDAGGRAVLEAFVPGQARGITVFVQAIEPDACRVSQRAEKRFE